LLYISIKGNITGPNNDVYSALHARCIFSVAHSLVCIESFTEVTVTMLCGQNCCIQCCDFSVLWINFRTRIKHWNSDSVSCTFQLLVYAAMTLIFFLSSAKKFCGQKFMFFITFLLDMMLGNLFWLHSISLALLPNFSSCWIIL